MKSGARTIWNPAHAIPPTNATRMREVKHPKHPSRRTQRPYHSARNYHPDKGFQAKYHCPTARFDSISLT
jgi:hypothetical protein